MPVIKVWGLPSGQTEDDLRHLHRTIVTAVTSIDELGLRDQNDMTCLFPPDLMLYGLGEEIIVEIDGLFAKPERTLEVCHRLAACVGSAIKNLYPKAKVECFITNFYPAQGFWTSAKPTVFICQVFSGCRCNICGGFFADGDEVCASGHQLGRQYAIK